MGNSRQKTVQISDEELIEIAEIARPFWEKGVSDNPPNFVILMGGVGVGKTTIRRQQFGNSYAHFDFGEIYIAVKKVMEKSDPKFIRYAVIASDVIFKKIINDKKNIVIEIIGDSVDLITPVINKMREIGYKVSINGVTADPIEAYKRHLKAVGEDKDYLSAFFTQEATLSFFYDHLGLGDMPIVYK